MFIKLIKKTTEAATSSRKMASPISEQLEMTGSRVSRCTSNGVRR